MKIKKSTLNFITITAVIVIFSYLIFKINIDAVLESEFREKNEFCSNLTKSLSEINKSCYCYYQPFISGDAALDSQTKALCGCDCIENGTPVSIGVLVTI